MLRELGVEVKIQLFSDASAAIGIAKRKGLGRVRHIDVTQLWIQEGIANGDIKLEKVDTKLNLADALTKNVKREDLQFHVRESGQEVLITGEIGED